LAIGAYGFARKAYSGLNAVHAGSAKNNRAHNQGEHGAKTTVAVVLRKAPP
jgi:hypothetical protein